MSQPTQKLRLSALIALVVGSMIGGGIFSLPQNMAERAHAGAVLIGWAITAVFCRYEACSKLLVFGTGIEPMQQAIAVMPYLSDTVEDLALRETQHDQGMGGEHQAGLE